MAPSAGHLHKLVIRNYKLIKAVWKKASINVQSQVSRLSRLQLQPIPISAGANVSGNSVAALARGKVYTSRTAARQFSTSSTRGGRLGRASLPVSKFSIAVNGLTGRTPFASTLRPNLTGGALPRTSGGYSLGSGRIGGARYFSHGPAAPAQVVQNVSQAVRAFCISGHKAQFDGVDPCTGEKRYRAVSTLQDKTKRKLALLPKATPGSYIDFSINPTITAFTPLTSFAGYSSPSSDESEFGSPCHINSTGLLDVLSADFSRALKDLLAVLNDLKALCGLGDLPITYRSPSVLRIHFAGCDAYTVENLCAELGVTRGIVGQDSDFDSFAGTEIALLFPFAPSETPSECDSVDDPPLNYVQQYYWQDAPLFPSEESDHLSICSNSGIDLFANGVEIPFSSDPEDPWLSSPESGQSVPKFQNGPSRFDSKSLDATNSPLEYQGFEGIYKFIELCDAAKR